MDQIAIDVGAGDGARRIAVLLRDGRGPTIVWFGGFRSDMRATKADAIDAWAAREGRRFLRFDYTGHGASGGAFMEATVSTWLEDALAVLARFAGEAPVLVGSSMGGWLALLACRALRESRPARAPSGLVLIAPAADFTERLMWDVFSPAIREEITERGVHWRPSAYSDEPYPITRALIADGRRHLVLDGPIRTGCHVHILQGMADPDVPHAHALRLVERLAGDSVQLTLVADGDHRLSRPEDLDRLIAAVRGAVSSG